MTLGSQEHEEIMAQFERLHRGRRLDREPKALWTRGIVYQDGSVNDLFLSYRNGYSYARCVYLNAAAA